MHNFGLGGFPCRSVNENTLKKCLLMGRSRRYSGKKAVSSADRKRKVKSLGYGKFGGRRGRGRVTQRSVERSMASYIRLLR